jgi:hypothetical protein
MGITSQKVNGSVVWGGVQAYQNIPHSLFEGIFLHSIIGRFMIKESSLPTLRQTLGMVPRKPCLQNFFLGDLKIIFRPVAFPGEFFGEKQGISRARIMIARLTNGTRI